MSMSGSGPGPDSSSKHSSTLLALDALLANAAKAHASASRIRTPIRRMKQPSPPNRRDTLAHNQHSHLPSPFVTASHPDDNQLVLDYDEDEDNSEHEYSFDDSDLDESDLCALTSSNDFTALLESHVQKQQLLQRQCLQRQHQKQHQQQQQQLKEQRPQTDMKQALDSHAHSKQLDKVDKPNTQDTMKPQKQQQTRDGDETTNIDSNDIANGLKELPNPFQAPVAGPESSLTRPRGPYKAKTKQNFPTPTPTMTVANTSASSSTVTSSSGTAAAATSAEGTIPTGAPPKRQYKKTILRQQAALLAAQIKDENEMRDLEATRRVMNRTAIIKHLRVLRSRLAYAHYKVNRGLEEQPLHMVAELFEESLEDSSEADNAKVSRSLSKTNNKPCATPSKVTTANTNQTLVTPSRSSRTASPGIPISPSKAVETGKTPHSKKTDDRDQPILIGSHSLPIPWKTPVKNRVRRQLKFLSDDDDTCSDDGDEIDIRLSTLTRPPMRRVPAKATLDPDLPTLTMTQEELLEHQRLQLEELQQKQLEQLQELQQMQTEQQLAFQRVHAQRSSHQKTSLVGNDLGYLRTTSRRSTLSPGAPRALLTSSRASPPISPSPSPSPSSLKVVDKFTYIENSTINPAPRPRQMEIQRRNTFDTNSELKSALKDELRQLIQQQQQQQQQRELEEHRLRQQKKLQQNRLKEQELLRRQRQLEQQQLQQQKRKQLLLQLQQHQIEEEDRQRRLEASPSRQKLQRQQQQQQQNQQRKRELLSASSRATTTATNKNSLLSTLSPFKGPSLLMTPKKKKPLNPVQKAPSTENILASARSSTPTKTRSFLTAVSPALTMAKNTPLPYNTSNNINSRNKRAHAAFDDKENQLSPPSSPILGRQQLVSINRDADFIADQMSLIKAFKRQRPSSMAPKDDMLPPTTISSIITPSKPPETDPIAISTLPSLTEEGSTDLSVNTGTTDFATTAITLSSSPAITSLPVEAPVLTPMPVPTSVSVTDTSEVLDTAQVNTDFLSCFDEWMSDLGTEDICGNGFSVNTAPQPDFDFGTMVFPMGSSSQQPDVLEEIGRGELGADDELGQEEDDDDDDDQSDQGDETELDESEIDRLLYSEAGDDYDVYGTQQPALGTPESDLAGQDLLTNDAITANLYGWFPTPTTVTSVSQQDEGAVTVIDQQPLSLLSSDPILSSSPIELTEGLGLDLEFDPASDSLWIQQELRLQNQHQYRNHKQLDSENVVANSSRPGTPPLDSTASTLLSSSFSDVLLPIELSSPTSSSQPSGHHHYIPMGPDGNVVSYDRTSANVAVVAADVQHVVNESDDFLQKFEPGLTLSTTSPSDIYSCAVAAATAATVGTWGEEDSNV
ncbi:hypothetical protein BX616_000334 [Lobosporangium transversale]|nr:hypothetical protein BX616_000334 [Lobosporangium transversale]